MSDPMEIDEVAPQQQTKEELKAIHNLEKSRRKAFEKQVAKHGLKQATENRRRLEEERILEHKKKVSDAAHLQVPGDCALDALELSQPKLYDYLTSGDCFIKTTKNQHLLTLRAIFFNNLDRCHSFSKDHRIARANRAMVQQALSLGTPVHPPLLVPFALACQEARLKPGKFDFRELYIKIWKDSPDEVHMYTKKEVREFDELVTGLQAALDEAAEEGTDVNRLAKDLRLALADSLGELDEVAEPELDTKGASSSNAQILHRTWLKDIKNALEAKVTELKEKKKEGDVVLEHYKARVEAFSDLEKMRDEAIRLGFKEYE